MGRLSAVEFPVGVFVRQTACDGRAGCIDESARLFHVSRISTQKGSFGRTESGWAASYRHPTPETRAEVAYNGLLEVNFSWRGEKWAAIAPGQTFTDVHL
jgi:hypothetical protein